MTRSRKADNNDEQPTFDDLIRYARGEAKAVQTWKDHIEADQELSSDVRLLKQIGGLVTELDLRRVVPAARKLASDIFDSFRTSEKLGAGTAAKLYYDSEAIPLPAGMRPSLLSERRLRFAADDGTIELMIVPEYPGRFEITGRVFTESRERCKKAKLAGRRKYEAQFDEFDFFTFASVPPGKYKLIIETEQREIIVSLVEL
jgi:hypothetical protein